MMQRSNFRFSGRARQNLTALLLSLILTLAVFVLLRFGQHLQLPDSPELTIRKVLLAAPPPPPPPPPPAQSRQAPQTMLSLDLDSGTATPLLQIEVPETLAKLDPLPPPPLQQAESNTDWERNLSIDWSALSPDQLDTLPQLLAMDKPVFPQALARRNIERVVVRLDIVIDEQGTVTLVRVIENPYPEQLDAAVRSLVRSARFSVPTRDGQAARTRFIWPVEIRQ